MLALRLICLNFTNIDLFAENGLRMSCFIVLEHGCFYKQSRLGNITLPAYQFNSAESPLASKVIIEKNIMATQNLNAVQDHLNSTWR